MTGDGDVSAVQPGPPAEQGWTVLYDADCGFCKWLLSGLLRWDRAMTLQPIALQRPEADELLADLEPAQRMASWHLISPDGTRRSGGAAVPPMLRLLPGGRVPAAVVGRFPGLADRGYRWTAAHRSQLSRWVPQRAKRSASESVQRREHTLGTRTQASARRPRVATSCCARAAAAPAASRAASRSRRRSCGGSSPCPGRAPA